MAFEFEREEHRDALRDSRGECPPAQHEMRRDGHGGGTCPCGFHVDADEL